MNKNFKIDNYSYFEKYVDEKKVMEILEMIKVIIKEKKTSIFSDTCIICKFNYFKNFKIYIHNLFDKILSNIFDIYYLKNEFKININKLPKKNKNKDVLQIFLSLTYSITRGSYIYFSKDIFSDNLINVKFNRGDILIFNYNILYGGFNSVMSKPNILLEFEVSNKEFKK